MAPTATRCVWTAEVECSSGTYVRTLAADLGTPSAAGPTSALRRTAIGSFRRARRPPPDDVQLLPVAEAMRDYPRICSRRGRAGTGAARRPARPGGLDGAPVAAVLDGAGEFVAVYRLEAGRAAAAVVLAPS